MKLNLEKHQEREAVRARLLRKAANRCVTKALYGWGAVHRSRRLAASLILRLSSRSARYSLKSAYAHWLQSLLQTRKLRSALTFIYRSHLCESLHCIALFSLQRLINSHRSELKVLPKNLEAHFLSNYEDRIKQMSRALEHDKELFHREKRGLVERQRRMQSVVSSQASRLYGELQADIDASTIRREEESETRIQPDNP